MTLLFFAFTAFFSPLSGVRLLIPFLVPFFVRFFFTGRGPPGQAVFFSIDPFTLVLHIDAPDFFFGTPMHERLVTLLPFLCLSIILTLHFSYPKLYLSPVQSFR